MIISWMLAVLPEICNIRGVKNVFYLIYKFKNILFQEIVEYKRLKF